MRATSVAATIFSLILCASASAAPCDGFVDVLASSPFCPDVTWIKTYGITKGCDPTHYCPTDSVSRLQMAAFLHRLGQVPAFVNGGNAFGTSALLGTTDNQPLIILTNNQPTLRLIPTTDSVDTNTVNVINGSPLNSVGAGVVGATIAGGGGTNGGTDYPNQANSNYATIGGGLKNTASGFESTVGGGFGNIASGFFSTVAGGNGNLASGSYSTVAGGADNEASGLLSFAAGNRAKATTNGSFIWADSQAFDFGPSVANFFGVRATGGVGLTVAIDGTGAVTQYCNLLPGVPSWQCTSDREAKENFVAADGKDILRRLAAMPLFSWNFKHADPAIRSLGPTAQDFYAAFGLGNDDKTIANLNLEGVALAAIQGLNQKLEERDAALTQLVQDKDREIAELKARIAQVESLRGEVAALRSTLAELRQDRSSVAVATK